MCADLYLVLSFVFHNNAIMLEHQKDKRAQDLKDFRDSKPTMNGFT